MFICKLFDLIFNLLLCMCLCMLMSLMLVVQYINVNYDKFDLVVFDEVLQMFICEVVGVIVCGNYVVVVGDLK